MLMVVLHTKLRKRLHIALLIAQLLSNELAASHRTQIRRANLIDLVQAALDRCRSRLNDQAPALEQLERALEEQKRKLVGVMSDRLSDERDPRRQRRRDAAALQPAEGRREL